jgi:hypothetical protein
MQVYLLFRMTRRGRDASFQDKEEVRMEYLANVGIKDEEEDVGNHVRKQPVAYSVNCKESVL